MKKNGAAGSKINLFEVPFTFRTEYEGGVMGGSLQENALGLLFEASRKKKRGKTMSEGCTHDCSTCGESCSERKAEDMKLRQNDYSNIKKGYSGSQRQGRRRQELVTSLLASASQARGFETAVMDADVTGPSIPKHSVYTSAPWAVTRECSR